MNKEAEIGDLTICITSGAYRAENRYYVIEKKSTDPNKGFDRNYGAVRAEGCQSLHEYPYWGHCFKPIARVNP